MIREPSPIGKFLIIVWTYFLPYVKWMMSIRGKSVIGKAERRPAQVEFTHLAAPVITKIMEPANMALRKRRL